MPSILRTRARQVAARPRPRPIRPDDDVVARLVDRIEAIESENDELAAQLAIERAEREAHRRSMAASLEMLAGEVVSNLANLRRQSESHLAEVSDALVKAIRETRAIPVHALLDPRPN